MDKTNNGNNKGEKRIEIQNRNKVKRYKKVNPKFENFNGNPIE